MFSGLVMCIGELLEWNKNSLGDAKMRIAVDQRKFDFLRSPPIVGASVCVDGVCLTLVELRLILDGKYSLSFDLSVESVERSRFSALQVGDFLNLERSLRAGDELGGHLVSGHVDGKAELLSRKNLGVYEALDFRLEAIHAKKIAPYLTFKGSVAINGVSLTVNDVKDDLQNASSVFGVLIIPETLRKTNLSKIQMGDWANIEADMMAKYVARAVHFAGSSHV